MSGVTDNSHRQSIVRERMKANHVAHLTQTPPWPRHLNVELSNVCNHSCLFCAYSRMERVKGSINTTRLEGWLDECYRLGSRDLGLHAGAEPFASPLLEHFTEYAKKLGYDYVYISTNGSLATPDRLMKIIDAGIDSIKFSINAGDRETYKKIHGKDDFGRVLDHLRFAHEYRGGRPHPCLSVSCVVVPENEATVGRLKELVRGWVDEIITLPATSQSGQMAVLGGTSPYLDRGVCAIPFNRLHISWEGFVRVCCNDYENLLAVEDLDRTSLSEAFYSRRFRELRQRHLENRLEGMLCHNCKNGCQEAVQPVNPDLYFATHKTKLGPPISHSSRIIGKGELQVATGAK